MMITGLFLLAALMMKLWPDTPFGAWLHRTMIVFPLQIVERIERKHLIFLVIGLFVIQSFAMVVTADVAVLAALDIATYVDVILAGWTVAAIARTRGSFTAFVGRFSVLLPRNGQRARRRRRLPMAQRRQANDDDADGGWALAA